MCFGADVPPPPPPPQEMKQPDSAALTDKSKRNRAGIMSSSLLTGPSGLSSGVSTGKSSLLGQ